MGTIYNDYERLGGPYEGSYATVYKVRHNQYGYVRALKVLKDSIISEDDRKYQTFLKECMMLLRIGNGSHPNIVRIYQPRLINNQAMVEMDYINGVELQKYLERTKFMPIDEVYRFIRQIGGALAYCHRDIYLDQLDWDADNLECDPQDGGKPLIDAAKEAELVLKYRVTHNDLHSCNVMRRHYDGNFILLDFGLAIQNGTAVKSSSLHQGAPEYRSPEKWSGDVVEAPQNDIYSFGVLLYEVLTGLPPFPLDRKSFSSQPEKEVFELMNKHLYEKPAPIEPKRKAAFEAAHPGEVWKRDYPEWLEQMVMKCLAKSPSDRYADAKELIEDFNRHMVEDEAVRMQPPHKDKSSQQQSMSNAGQTAALGATKPSVQQGVPPVYPAVGGASLPPPLPDEQSDPREMLSKYAKYIIPSLIALAILIAFLVSDGTGTGQEGDLINTDSIYKVGCFYLNGTSGYTKDESKAVEYFRQAAEKGHPMAQNNLAWCYKEGKGVQQSYTEAVKWYRKSADQGYPLAQFNLGWRYEHGEGVPKSISEAIKWYRKAAAKGESHAQAALKRLGVSE